MIGTDEARVLVATGAGDFSLFEQTVRPSSVFVPLHVHRIYDEGFLVLAGEMEFDIGDGPKMCGSGEFVFAPRGTPHRFRNPGAIPARLLVVGSSPVQALVEEIGPLVAATRPDLNAIVDAFARFESDLVL